MVKRPNVLLILNDDMGFSDIGCYGGEVDTPNLDSLADKGLRFTQFYNTARCCPSRASLLTGLYPHQTGIGHMMADDGIDGYLGDLGNDTVTIAEVLKNSGYCTYMSGKWHVTNHDTVDGKKHNWPLQRGFDRFYGLIRGASDYFNPQHLIDGNDPAKRADDADYYLTDDISDRCCRMLREHANTTPDKPFFSYLAYTAPHWPLHAPEDAIAKYKGRFDKGWDELREQRLQRLKEMGLISDSNGLSARDDTIPPWDEEENKEWQARRMEVYAAQIDIMDQGIGRVLDTLRETGQFDNTIIIFMADNGGCAEELHDNRFIRMGKITSGKTLDGRDMREENAPSVIPGADDTFCSYGVHWANVSNTPFRLYKHWVHEGGIATPLIVHYPAGNLEANGLRHQPYQLPDIMATLCDMCAAEYPNRYKGRDVLPHEGVSMATSLYHADADSTRKVLYWEHEGNCAIRKGKWKLVKKYPQNWELFDIDTDRSEIHDLSNENPDIVNELQELYQSWATRCDVMPWSDLINRRKKR